MRLILQSGLQPTVEPTGFQPVGGRFYANSGTLGFQQSVIRLASITDGTSNTMLLSESNELLG